MHVTEKHKQIFNEINITPLTDIFLVLLIIMMVVAPMMNQMRKDIKPPQIQNGQPVEQNRLTVEVTGDGAYYVQGQATTAEQLTETLKTQSAALLASTGAAEAPVEAAPIEEGAEDPTKEKNIIIRADKTTKTGAIMKVFEAARDAEFTKVTVAGEALTSERQGELQSGQAGNAESLDASAEGEMP